MHPRGEFTSPRGVGGRVAVGRAVDAVRAEVMHVITTNWRGTHQLGGVGGGVAVGHAVVAIRAEVAGVCLRVEVRGTQRLA
eukprot:4640969-Pyramimonas_sp.AAC.1